ncbi:MAG: ASCH domain-containing protein [Verrucomicrobia bacterium]|nr:ASCH domain-containing protein [Verrucomicrobiota bacterium]MBV8640367.1 ASCH domain-containing protein [Verrucomicrobiota bacterium]
MEISVLKFWRAYTDSLPAGSRRQEMPADVFAFGDSREMADRLAKLVQDGVKTATCSALWSYEDDQKPLPQTEDQSVVIDGNGAPVAIIETVAVFVVPFNEVPEQFAYDEGEGDRSLAYWREAHRNYFSRQPFKDRVFGERMPLVCERFRVVHIAPT